MNAMPLFLRHRARAGLAALTVAAMGWALLPHASRQSTVQFIDDICSAVSRPMFASAPAPEGSAAAARPQTSTKVISCEALPNVPGKSVTAVEVTFPAGAVSAPHHHAGSVLVYVLQGAVRSQIGDAAPTVYHAGQSFFEPPGAHHVASASASATEPARILAVFVADDGATLTTYDK